MNSRQILIVEDEHALAAALGAMVRRLGFEPLPCYSGQRALELAVEAWGADRILFGSDYPIVPIDPTLEAVNHARISAKDREKILSTNGLELLESKAVNHLAVA